MGFQTIGEKVIVAGVYTGAKFYPKKFLWQKQTYLIEKITLVTDMHEGQTKKRMYSVTVGSNLYRLVFNRDSEVWVLEEVWSE
ncbi:MAG TPA: hypothetical protein VLH19_03980 [Patescibacteria group bacterium]|nr:hypothetical protein [Patescibacteria group bacterium]